MEHLFDQAYEAADKASERTRSVYYIFLIINFAVFLAAYSTEVYRRPGERVDDFLKAALCVQRPGSKEVQDWGTIGCQSAIIKARAWGYDLDKLQALNNVLKPFSWFDDFTKSRIHELLRQDVASRQVQVPIVGLLFDVDLLWILTSYSGPLGMLIILSCLRVELDLVGIMRPSLRSGTSQEQIIRTRLILSTQVLLSKTNKNTSISEISTQLYKSIFMRSIFFLPIITQVLEMYSDLDVRDLVFTRDQSIIYYFIDEILRHPVMEGIKISSEFLALALMAILFARFSSTTRDLQKTYGELQQISADENPESRVSNLSTADQITSLS